MFLDQKNTPRWMIFMIDIVLAIASIGFAYLLRFSFSVPQRYIEKLPEVLMAVILVRALSFVIARVYSGIIRYTGTQDLIRIFIVNFSGSTLFVLMNMVFRYGFSQPHLIPYNIIIIDFFILTLLMTSYRMLIKIAFIELNNPTRNKSDVIIFGAGDTGLMAKRAIERDTRNRQKVVAYIDDNPSKHRKKLENVLIYPLSKLDELLDTQTVDQVVIAIPTITPQRKSEVVEKCLKHNTRVMSVPPVARWIDGELSYMQLRRIRIEELLERDEIVINTERIEQDLKGKTIMVTGAAGSIGSELVRQIIKFNPGTIILLDQAETPLHDLELEINGIYQRGKVEIELCDITDEVRISRLFRKYKPNLVFHAAAYKHVPMMEQNPREAVRTNVLGTKMIADISESTGVEKFIMISTDKAVNPTSIMGATKRMAEIYIQTLNNRSNTIFITTRFGNVLGSNGSVVTLFRRQIENGGPVTVTHPDVTRFFMTIPEASRLVLEAASMGGGGEIFLFNMGESIKIIDLARKMIKLSGLTPGVDIQIMYTGLRPGEKLYEELLNHDENAIHTGHPHILAAKVREYEWPYVTERTAELLLKMREAGKFEIVKYLKDIIPEYISKNSIYEQLD
jgi:FlaA1/EpsC-like NDP-sugar epimerase